MLPNIATDHLTQEVSSKMVHKTGSSKYQQKHAVWCEKIHIILNSCQLIIQYIASVRRELRDQLVSVCNVKHPRWTNPFVHEVLGVESHDVVILVILEDECDDMRQ